MRLLDPDAFEAGFAPVTAILRSNTVIARVGVRSTRGVPVETDARATLPERTGPHPASPADATPDVVRIELPDGRALEFDAEGRLILAQIEGRGLRRTLDNRLLVTRHVRQGARRGWTREPSPEHPAKLLTGWHAEAGRLRDEIASGGGEVVCLRGLLGDPAGWTRRRLEVPARWDETALEADTRRLREIYLPIPILPPDQYASVVLQATEGCGFNRCGFCDFYRSIPYRERSVEEFERHLDAVLAHLGRTARRYHRVFLGQANAMLIDTGLLLRHLEAVRRRLPLLPGDLPPPDKRAWRRRHALWIEGIYSFVDSFHRSKSPQELRALADAGLRRAYLGLETGCPEVMRVLEKPGRPESAISLARNLHAAGIHLGVIVLVGAGGRPHEESHVRETLAVLDAMALRKGDQVYLSRLVIHEGSEYAAAVRRRGLTPLTDAELRGQQERLRRETLAITKVGVPVSSYDIALSRRVFSA